MRDEDSSTWLGNLIGMKEIEGEFRDPWRAGEIGFNQNGH